MKKYFKLFFFILLNNINTIRSQNLNFFKLFTPQNNKINASKININPIKLQNAAKYTLKKLSSYKNNNNNKIVNIQKIKETLRFIIALIENDKKNKRPFRILNPSFVNKYFKFIKWNGDQLTAKKNGKIIRRGKIYLTHYATFQVNGSYHQTKKYPYALYKIINNYFDKELRKKISKQNILTGRLNLKIYNNKVKPLVWLTRDGLEEALMQGNIIAKMPDGKKKIFCVSKSNEFRYRKDIKNRKDQKRYWYFTETTNSKENNIIKIGSNIFAGDIKNIGFGKIIAIKYRNLKTKKIEMQIGILADSGGAFSNNLYQLDSYQGTFIKKQSFYKKISPIPTQVDSYILVKK